MTKIWEVKLLCGVLVYLAARNRVQVLTRFWDWGYIPDDLEYIRPYNTGDCGNGRMEGQTT